MTYEETIKKAKEFINVNDIIRIYYGEKNFNNKTIHIRAIIDEEQVVFCWYGKYKQRWFYAVEHLYFFALRLESDNLIKTKRKDT